MSQSCDSVANMHEFIFTVSSHTQRKSKYHLPLAVCCMLYANCLIVHMVQCACSSTNFEPIIS